MNERFRRAASALLLATALIVGGSPVLASPHDESATAPDLARAHGFAEILSWFVSWLHPTPVQSHAASGGHTIDPNGQPAAPDPEGGSGFAPEGGGTMDPDG